MPSDDSPRPNSELLQIGEVADRVGLSLRSVRYYEEVELLTPTARSEGGFRLFDQSQVDRLLLIKRMKPIGMSLDDMRLLLDARESLHSADSDQSIADADARLREFVETAEKRCEEFESQLRSARELAEQIRTELDQHD
ncbi:MAG: MerR family transcriptional regulator [Solirubrobacterales bacterium]